MFPTVEGVTLVTLQFAEPDAKVALTVVPTGRGRFKFPALLSVNEKPEGELLVSRFAFNTLSGCGELEEFKMITC